MPRSSRARSSAPSRPMRPSSPPPPSSNRSVPAHAPPAQMAPPMAAQPRAPGLMGQMAATAGGVAIGSAVGHTIGAALSGGMGGRGQEQVPAQQDQQQVPQQYGQQPYYNQQQTQGNQGPCARELAQFVDCASQYSSDLSMCTGFNEVLKQCRVHNNLSPAQP